MKTTNRLAFLIALISSFFITAAQASSEHKTYLEAINDEVMKADQRIGTQPELVDNRLLPVQSSSDSFLTVMKNKYPASRKVFDQMPVQHQNQILTNYQVHLDMNKFRLEMMNILRNL